MITEALMNVGAQLLAFLVNFFPSVPVPGWLVTGVNQIGNLFSQMGLISHWFPVWLLGPAVGVVLVAMSSGFLIKMGRTVLSIFTGGGGGSG